MNIYWQEHTGPHNIGHFLDDMCIPFYGALKKHNLYGKDFQLIIKKNPEAGKCILPEMWKFLCKRPIKYVKTHHKVPDTYRKMHIDGLGTVVLPRARYKDFSNDTLDFFNIKRKKPERIILIQRSTRRNFSNEEELIEGLKSLGREVYPVEFGSMPFKQQLQELQDCAMLIGYHGAGLMNTVFTPAKSSTLEILPYGWVYGRYKQIGLARGQNYIQWLNNDPTKTKSNRPTKFDTSISPLQNKNVIQKRHLKKGTKDWKRASEVKIFFQAADTFVDVDAIVKITKKALKV